jgi:UDP-N-acetylmuramyl pentapeptide phosphotransferase/UDP-N-acetylglucosamine-1-phosphate transferase
MHVGRMAKLLLIETLSPAIAAITAWIVLGILTRRRRLLLDRPNERSLHAVPVPRVGGLAIVPAIAAAWLCLPGAISWAVWVPTIFLFGLSLLDDTFDLRVSWRLVAHIVVGMLSSYALVMPTASWISAGLAALAIAWMTNLYNFMDGSDGLAGGMAVIGFSVYAIAALVADAPTFAQACLAIAAAAAIFLRYNFHPARVFLGDAGSVPLGFLAAALGAQGWSNGLWPVWFPLLVFSPFIIDASVTLMRRTLRRERIWSAHRDHYYQRLVRLGWGHRRTALAEYLLMATCGVAALVALKLPAVVQMLLIAIGAVAYVFLMHAIDHAWLRHREPSK